jgi:hypothetical protein
MGALPAIKRDRLILLGIGVVAMGVLLWLGLIRPLEGQVDAHSREMQDLAGQIQQSRQILRLADSVMGRLTIASNELRNLELSMAQGDIYRWIINSLLTFQSAHEIDFSTFDQPVVGPWLLPPQAPYSLATFTVSGLATYREFGRFLADFENQFPQLQWQSLELERAPESKGDEERSSRLLFHLKFSLPVRPTAVTH